MRLIEIEERDLRHHHPASLGGDRFHDVAGTDGADWIVGSGTLGVHYFGGLGSDEINVGIPNLSRIPSNLRGDANGDGIPDFYMLAYGGWSLPGFHNRAVTMTQPRLTFDGNDKLHGGAASVLVGGNGRDWYFAHAFIPEEFKMIVPRFDPDSDTLIFENSRGFDVENVRYFSRFDDQGRKIAEVKSVHLVGHGNPSGPQAVQHIDLGFDDDPRDPDPGQGYFDVRWSGSSPDDEVRAALQAGALAGHQRGDDFSLTADDHFLL